MKNNKYERKSDKVKVDMAYCGYSPEELYDKILEYKTVVLKEHPSAGDWKCELDTEQESYSDSVYAHFYLEYKRDWTEKEIQEQEKYLKNIEDREKMEFERLSKKFNGK